MISYNRKPFALGMAAGAVFCCIMAFLGLFSRSQPKAYTGVTQVSVDTNWQSYFQVKSNADFSDIIRRGIAAKEAEDAWKLFVTTNQDKEVGINFDKTNHVEEFNGLALNFYSRWPAPMPLKLESPADREFGVKITSNLGQEKLIVELSCGNRISFGPGTSIPTTNVPCPCGNTNHWLWYFKSE